MVTAVIALVMLVVVLGALLVHAHISLYTLARNHEDNGEKRLLSHLQYQSQLQEDIRALTHSLCRSNQVPYIPPVGKRELEPPSGGYFDKRPAPPLMPDEVKGMR